MVLVTKDQQMLHTFSVLGTLDADEAVLDDDALVFRAPTLLHGRMVYEWVRLVLSYLVARDHRTHVLLNSQLS